MNHKPVYRTAPATPGVLNIRSSFHDLAAQNIAFGHIMSHGLLIELGGEVFFQKKFVYGGPEKKEMFYIIYIVSYIALVELYTLYWSEIL